MSRLRVVGCGLSVVGCGLRVVSCRFWVCQLSVAVCRCVNIAQSQPPQRSPSDNLNLILSLSLIPSKGVLRTTSTSTQLTGAQTSLRTEHLYPIYLHGAGLNECRIEGTKIYSSNGYVEGYAFGFTKKLGT